MPTMGLPSRVGFASGALTSASSRPGDERHPEARGSIVERPVVAEVEMNHFHRRDGLSCSSTRRAYASSLEVAIFPETSRHARKVRTPLSIRPSTAGCQQGCWNSAGLGIGGVVFDSSAQSGIFTAATTLKATDSDLRPSSQRVKGRSL
jgi:hypothetical protein